MPLTHVIVVDFRTGPRRWAEFDVDVETATISNPRSEGLDARVIIGQLKHAHETFKGEIWFDWMESYKAKPPLSDPQSMAWSLRAIGYKLEGDLARYPWPKRTPLPPGAIS